MTINRQRITTESGFEVWAILDEETSVWEIYSNQEWGGYLGSAFTLEKARDFVDNF